MFVHSCRRAFLGLVAIQRRPKAVTAALIVTKTGLGTQRIDVGSLGVVCFSGRRLALFVIVGRQKSRSAAVKSEIVLVATVLR